MAAYVMGKMMGRFDISVKNVNKSITCNHDLGTLPPPWHRATGILWLVIFRKNGVRPVVNHEQVKFEFNLKKKGLYTFAKVILGF